MKNEAKRNTCSEKGIAVIAEIIKSPSAKTEAQSGQHHQALSREAMERILRKRCEIDQDKRAVMLGLLEIVALEPLSIENVGMPYYRLWNLKDEHTSGKVWDGIIGSLLQLKRGVATALALAYEDIWAEKQKQEHGSTFSVVISTACFESNNSTRLPIKENNADIELTPPLSTAHPPSTGTENQEKHGSTPTSDRPTHSGNSQEKVVQDHGCDANTTKPNRGITSGYEDHPLASIFPLMSDDELQDLTEDIARNGLLEAIVLYEGKILDGRNRNRGCIRSGRNPRYIEFQGTDPAAFVLSKNILRRNLTKSQRAAIAADLLPMLEAEALRRHNEKPNDPARDHHGQFAKGPDVEKFPPTEANGDQDLQPTQRAECRRSRDVAAESAGVNSRYVSDAKLIKEDAADLHEQVREGKLTLAQAKKELLKRNLKVPKAKTVEPQPFAVIFWDDAVDKTPMPKILADKKRKKTLPNAVLFHLTAKPKLSIGSVLKDGFRDAAVFVVRVDGSHCKTETGEHRSILQKPSCFFLVARTCGDVPAPDTVFDQFVEGGPIAVREMITSMWPTARRIISIANGIPPAGWQIG